MNIIKQFKNILCEKNIVNQIYFKYKFLCFQMCTNYVFILIDQLNKCKINKI